MSKSFNDLCFLTKRNVKIYFKDKVSFLFSMITPLVLVVLFITFLKSVYRSSLLSFFPDDVVLPTKLVNGFCGGWLLSSILGTTCVTLAFCSNIIMVTDKVNRTGDDIDIAPVKPYVKSLAYFISNFASTIIVCLICMFAGFIYLAIVGWYLTIVDVLMILVDVILCTLFGTLLACIVESFLNSQGAVSAVATLMSSMYGFLCGAYMPISQFSTGIQNFVAFIPGTYGTVLFRFFYMRGTISEIGAYTTPEAVNGIQAGFDNSIYFFGNEVSKLGCFLIVLITDIVLLALYIALVYLKQKKHSNKQ